MDNNQNSIIYLQRSNNSSVLSSPLINYGTLQISVANESNGRPIPNAFVQIYSEEDFSNILYKLHTDRSGLTAEVKLPAPPLALSQTPGPKRPYSVYNLRITAPNYQTVIIYGTQIFPTVGSIQPVDMPMFKGQTEPKIVRIDPHVLYLR